VRNIKEEITLPQNTKQKSSTNSPKDQTSSSESDLKRSSFNAKRPKLTSSPFSPVIEEVEEKTETPPKYKNLCYLPAPPGALSKTPILAKMSERSRATAYEHERDTREVRISVGCDSGWVVGDTALV